MGSFYPTDIEQDWAFDDELEEKVELLNSIQNELFFEVALLN